MRSWIIGSVALTWFCGLPSAPQSFGQIANSRIGELAETTEAGMVALDFLQSEIKPPSQSNKTAGLGFFKNLNSNQSAIKMGAAVVLVVSLFLLFVFLTRKTGVRSRKQLPTSVLRIIGQIRLDQTQQLRLIRVGEKILLVASAPHGSHTLSEITDPSEVQQIEALCGSGVWPTSIPASRETATKARPSPAQAPVPQPSQTLLEA